MTQTANMHTDHEQLCAAADVQVWDGRIAKVFAEYCARVRLRETINLIVFLGRRCLRSPARP